MEGILLVNLQNLEDVVRALATEVFVSSEQAVDFNLVLITNGYIRVIEFCGIELWNSDSNEELGSSVEEIEQSLREKLRIMLKNISQIRL